MNKLTDIKGIIFDYGGTIDTNSRHWAEVLWEKYATYEVPVSKADFVMPMFMVNAHWLVCRL